MKLKAFFLSSFLISLFSIAMAQDNQLSKTEKDNGWVLLFNGKDFKGWQSPSGENPTPVWQIENGILSLKSSDNKRHMDMITANEYGDFDLKVDFKLTEGANAGVKYFFSKYENGGWLGLEYQIIDNARHPDAKDPDRRLSALYDLFAPKQTMDVQVGAWNHLQIHAKGKEVVHYLNGKEVLRFDRSSDAFAQARTSSKFKDAKPAFGSIDKGHILIQDHGDMVYFKNIKIKPL